VLDEDSASATDDSRPSGGRQTPEDRVGVVGRVEEDFIEELPPPFQVGQAPEGVAPEYDGAVFEAEGFEIAPDEGDGGGVMVEEDGFFGSPAQGLDADAAAAGAEVEKAASRSVPPDEVEEGLPQGRRRGPQAAAPGGAKGPAPEGAADDPQAAPPSVETVAAICADFPDGDPLVPEGGKEAREILFGAGRDVDLDESFFGGKGPHDRQVVVSLQDRVEIGYLGRRHRQKHPRGLRWTGMGAFIHGPRIAEGGRPSIPEGRPDFLNVVTGGVFHYHNQLIMEHRNSRKRPALLVLEDGTAFSGQAFGAEGEKRGEVVFNTSMAGYQEITTDPSYCGQIVTMTYPLIGNYGANPEDLESKRPWVEGFVVRELSPIHSNWRATESLDAFLASHGVVGLTGVDTRALTRHIRSRGAMRGVISTVDLSPSSLERKALDAPGLVGRDMVKEVTCGEPWRPDFPGKKRFRVAVIDCGVKSSILRCLSEVGCDLTVFPASTPPDEIMKSDPRGIFVSNGPGDPDAVPYVIRTVNDLLGERPLFGICLGHQMLSLALGGKSYKLKFGHRGGNHPVRDERTGRIAITVQNHGFCIDPDSLDPEVAELTHVNLYDRTLEGIRHRLKSAFSVQYHPEASPGPRDARYLFAEFRDLMEGQGKN